MMTCRGEPTGKLVHHFGNKAQGFRGTGDTAGGKKGLLACMIRPEKMHPVGIAGAEILETTDPGTDRHSVETILVSGRET